MGKIRFKNNILKYISIVLVMIFLITAALMFLEVWEKKQGRFSGFNTEDGVLTHNGTQYAIKENVESFLVLGLDKNDGESISDSHESGVQADFLMLFVFDNDAKKCTAVHINRDTMATVNKLSVGGATVVDTFTKQIALAYNYVASENDKIRCRNTKDSVESLLCDINIDHYLSLTLDSVPAMNDLVGGVELTVLDDFTGIDDTLVKGQKVTLMGEQALRYVRTRYGLEDNTNRNRMERQKQYINALYEKTVSRISADEEFLLNFVTTVNEYVVYDSSDEKMQKFAEKFNEYEFVGIKEIDGETKLGEEYVEFYPDEESVKELVVDLFYTPIEKE